jgi:hydrogenase nickel incorporation protein HypA/HybF
MHELSIAMGIIDIVEDQAGKARATTISEIEIEVGMLAGVALDALEFALEVAVKGTILEDAARKIMTIPGRGKCCSCVQEFDIENFFSRCPECGGINIDIIQGEELRVKSITVD